MHKMTGEVCDPWRLVILDLNTLFCMQKPQVMSGTHRDLQFWPKVAVLHEKPEMRARVQMDFLFWC